MVEFREGTARCGGMGVVRRVVKIGVKEAYFDRISGVRKGKRQVFNPATGWWVVVKSRVNAHRVVVEEGSSNKRI